MTSTSDNGLRERLESFDLHCESFFASVHPTAVRGYDECIKGGRRVFAEYADDQACWPCRIRAALQDPVTPDHTRFGPSY